MSPLCLLWLSESPKKAQSSQAFSVYLDMGTMKNFKRGEENAERKSLKEAQAGLCAHGDL